MNKDERQSIRLYSNFRQRVTSKVNRKNRESDIIFKNKKLAEIKQERIDKINKLLGRDESS